eukprot:Pgem_evm1s19490
MLGDNVTMDQIQDFLTTNGKIMTDAVVDFATKDVFKFFDVAASESKHVLAVSGVYVKGWGYQVAGSLDRVLFS